MSDRVKGRKQMNWKAVLPVAALLALIVPSAAFSNNHHGMGGQNGMMSQFGNNGGQFLGASNHSIAPFANSGVNPYAVAPVANVNPYGMNSFSNNGMGFGSNVMGFGGNSMGFGGNNGLLGMNNGGMCGRHRHHHKRRGLMSLMNQNSSYGGMGMGNMGYGTRSMMGNSYGYGGGGLTGGLRNMLGRL
jgi:hypothetical protein